MMKWSRISPTVVTLAEITINALATKKHLQPLYSKLHMGPKTILMKAPATSARRDDDVDEDDYMFLFVQLLQPIVL